MSFASIPEPLRPSMTAVDSRAFSPAASFAFGRSSEISKVTMAMSGRASSEARPTTETVGVVFEALGSWAKAESPSATLAKAKIKADLLSIETSCVATAATRSITFRSRPKARSPPQAGAGQDPASEPASESATERGAWAS